MSSNALSQRPIWAEIIAKYVVLHVIVSHRRLTSSKFIMSSKYVFSQAVRELRILFCQSSQQSAATRYTHQLLYLCTICLISQVFHRQSVSYDEKEQSVYANNVKRGSGYRAENICSIWYAHLKRHQLDAKSVQDLEGKYMSHYLVR